MIFAQYENDFVRVVLDIAGLNGEVIIHGRIFSMTIGNSTDDKALTGMNDTFFDFNATTIKALESVSKDEDDSVIEYTETIVVKRQPHTWHGHMRQ